MSEQVRQRRAVGRPRVVTAMQRLVPEPLDAAVTVGHRGSHYRNAATVGVAIVVASIVRDQRSDIVSYLVVGTALYLSLWTVGGVVMNASSPLRLGPWYCARNQRVTTQSITCLGRRQRSGISFA